MCLHIDVITVLKTVASFHKIQITFLLYVLSLKKKKKIQKEKKRFKPLRNTQSHQAIKIRIKKWDDKKKI